jgi:signal transduction histidine kinase
MPTPSNNPDSSAEKRYRAEQLAAERRNTSVSPYQEADSQRLLHELEVHQIELEMQNSELEQARDEMLKVLEKYTDLYDFAPVGYLSLDREGIIREVNLAGSVMLGVPRSVLPKRRFGLFVSLGDRAVFADFLMQVFVSGERAECEVRLQVTGGQPLDVRMQANVIDSGQACRVALMDITQHKRAEAAQRRLDVLTASNLKLKEELVQRQAAKKALQQSEQELGRLLLQARLQQDRLRDLTHGILHAQEEERKRISRELHDVIAQALVGINVHVAALTHEAAGDPESLQRKINNMHRVVEDALDIVHRFARELRPTMLDDLGLIPALQSFMKSFMEDTGIRASLKVFAGIEKSSGPLCTTLYRVAQESLTNVARHAKASQVELSICCLDDIICMEIKDDGHGFAVEKMLGAKKKRRLGLLGMRERVEMIGGRFQVESAPGQATTIRVEIPVEKDRLK